MADGAMRYLGVGRNNQLQQGGRHAAAVAIIRRRRRRRLLLLDFGRALMLLGALVLTRQLITTTSSDAELYLYHMYDVLVALLLWLLGVALATLSLVVAPRFPWLALAGATVAAAALRNHHLLLGGL